MSQTRFSPATQPRFLGKGKDRSSMSRRAGFVPLNAFSIQNAIRSFPGNEIAVLRRSTELAKLYVGFRVIITDRPRL